MCSWRRGKRQLGNKGHDRPVSGTETSLSETEGQMVSATSVPLHAAPADIVQQLDAVSTSLRQAYSATVAEDVPDVLLDLLSKLK
jgi:hypothetical protein